MRRARRSALFFLFVGMAAVLWAMTPRQRPAIAQAPDAKGAFATAKFRGADQCLSCHTSWVGGREENFVLLTEHTTWRLCDRHSLAYAALVGPRGQRIAAALKQDVLDAKTGCLGCHSLNQPGRIEGDEARAETVRKEGVSCEVCHGPSSEYYGPHSNITWRQKSAAEKFDLGLYDVRNPARRADLCYSCHIGNAGEGKVVSHAMMAAGHPPLTAGELATFSEQMPRHWRLPADVPYLKRLNTDKDAKTLDYYHFASANDARTQLVHAGSTGALAAALRLVEERSSLAGAKDAARRWPELTLEGFAPYKDDLPGLWPQLAMAQSDCYGCHHELRRPGWRQLRGYTGPPGRPQLATWPQTLARLGIGLDADRHAAFTKEWAEVTKAVNARPFGAPADLAAAAATCRKPIHALLHRDDYAFAVSDHARLWQALCSVPADDYPDFDAARQIVAALSIVHVEKPDIADEAQAKLLGEWRDKLGFNLELKDRADRQKVLIEVVARATKQKLTPTPALLAALDQITDHGVQETEKSDPKKTKALETLLNALLKSPPLTQTLLDKDNGFLEKLDKVSNERLTALFEKRRDYDSVAFKEALKVLGAKGSPNRR